MTEHLCEQCGSENARDAQFCTKCDFYLGWDSGGGSLDGAPLTSSLPVVRETHSQKFPAVSHSQLRHSPSPHSGRRPTPAPSGRPAEAPTVSIEHPEVELDPDGGGTVEIRIRNRSSIVDGYTVTAPRAPEWLNITHPEIRVLTDEECVTAVSLAVREGFDVYVQRFRLPIQICSVENPAKRVEAELVVTVPRVGGPITMIAEPQVLRLRDQTSGRIRLRLDNSGSNYPQRYSLTGTDPENVVRFGFRPNTVEVPPRRCIYVDVRFDVPPIDYGQQAPRILKLTAASDQGPVEAIVNVAQERSPAPADSPVRLRLERTVTRVRDTTSARIVILVDNRRGSRDRRLAFAGRDPEGVVRFAFSQPRLYVRAGEQARIFATVQAPLPRPGEEIERPISVLCHDGRDESEATGSLVLAASASPMTTAQLRLEPEHVSVRNRRRGRFRVTLDNTKGALPLHAWFSGTDPEGLVRFTFTPPRLEIPPGATATAALRVWSKLPDAGKETSREITVRAEDGNGAVEDQGRFTQSMWDFVPLIRLVATLVGGLLVALGAIRPWFLGGPTYDIGRLGELQKLFAIRASGEMTNIGSWMLISQPAVRAVILLLAGVMMLGILSASGKYTIISGFLAAAVVILYVVFAMSKLQSNGPAYGVSLVVVGGIIGIIGGFCIKRSSTG